MNKKKLILALIFLAVSLTYANAAENSEALYIEGRQLFEINKIEAAKEKFEKAAEIDRKAGAGSKKDLAVYLGWIGKCYKQLSQYDRALEYYRKSLAINEELGIGIEIAFVSNSIGLIYHTLGQHDLALDYFNKALALKEKFGERNHVATQFNNIGLVYHSKADYDRALEYYNKALKINEELGIKDQVANQLNNIGLLYYYLGKYDMALANYNKAVRINEELGLKGDLAFNLNNMGMVYNAWGQYDKAISYYRQALVIDKKLGRKDQIAADLNNMGQVFYSWGQYKKALDYFKTALDINDKLGAKDKAAVHLNNIGQAYYALEQFDMALENYQKALAINEKLGIKNEIASNLNNIGMILKTRMNNDKAMEYFTRAMSINEQLGLKVDVAVQLNNIGLVYFSKGDFNKALEYYRKSLAIDEELRKKDSIATSLNNIGAAYWWLKDYKNAADFLNRAVKIKEEMRLTAAGAVRRDYFASELSTYEWLISTYIRDNKPALAFNKVELSSAKYLIEKLGEKINEKSIRIADINEYQKKLQSGCAIISYSSITLDIRIARIVADKKTIYSSEIQDQNFNKVIKNNYIEVINSNYEKMRGISIKTKKDHPIDEHPGYEFDKLINYYRYLLSRQDLTDKENDSLKQISKGLYNLLFSGLDKQLEGKSELIIIPGGILALIPFETLIMPDGRYLVEKYNIKYTQSLTVSEILDKRKYDDKRKPLLAFGGAVYDRISYKKDMIESEKQLDDLKNTTLAALSRGESIRKTYASLGYREWDNLPGTLAEVRAIDKIIKNSELFTGDNVDESGIKILSLKGELKKYRVIHFATHGLVVAEFPELSALVLSQYKEEKNGEDGFLRMNEIAALDLNADFVCLSACETGLGKIYGGEGVVGLTQAFLLAGANGMSVSLWQVDDKSTMEFMIGMYNLVNVKKINYDKAINEMKRKFIKGKYQSPFYWAPFIYYGK